MSGILKALLLIVMAQTAPIVCLVYRKGWYVTPDDPVSPFGCGTTPGSSREPAMVKRYEKWGKFWADWWWCGMRNRVYGLAYALKPDHFKQLTTYTACQGAVVKRGPLRTITIDGYKEWMLSLGLFHIIAGYRLRPIYDGITDGAPYRPINMDARPILSLRAGAKDD